MAAVASVRMIVFDEIYGEGFLHRSRGSRQGDGAALRFIAPLQHVQVILTGKRADPVNVGGIGAIGLGKFAMVDELVFVLRSRQWLAVFENHGDFEELMRVGWSDGPRPWKRGVFGTFNCNPFRVRHVLSPLGCRLLEHSRVPAGEMCWFALAKISITQS
jgi:hypothetical protein